MKTHSRSLALAAAICLFSGAANAGIVAVDPALAGLNQSGQSQVAAGSLLLKNRSALENWQKGYAALNSGQLDAAEALFSQAMSQEPKAYEPLLAMADLELRRSRPQEAEALLKRAFAVEPQSAVVAATMGRFAAGTNRNAEAETQLKRAIKLDPKLVMAYLDLGEVHLASGRVADAVNDFKGALEANPAHPGAAYGLGRAQAAAKDLPAALAAFEQAAKNAPKNPLPLMAIAELQAHQGAFDQALATADKAVAVDPKMQRAQLTRIDVLIAAKRMDQAHKELERYIAEAKGPASGVLLFKLASVQLATGKDGDAFTSYKRATEADPSLHAAWNNLAWQAVKQKRDLPLAQDWAKRAVELAPGAVTYLDTLAAVQGARGDWAGAEESLKRALKQAPGAPYLHYRLGQVQDQRGNSAQALESYKAALSTGQAFDGADDARRRVAALGGKK